VTLTTIQRLTPERLDDFHRLHEQSGCGCFCVAWWVPTWEEWGERTHDDNRALREWLNARGELDGYLLYAKGEPIGWCQVGPRDRLTKLTRQYHLEPDPAVWAITCLFVQPQFRHAGVAQRFVGLVLSDLARRGVTRVQTFPKRAPLLDDEDVWTGPERLYAAAGFSTLRDDDIRPVMERVLAP
jgi:GNAT superfamily N-acetyltransferase